MLCAGGSISMSTRLSRWALLAGLAFAVPTLGPTIAEAQAEVPGAANLYPGRYAAVCTPGPIFGCVCVIDSSGEALMFTEFDSVAGYHLQDVADSEYLRMISWLRRNCESLTQPETARSVAADGAGDQRRRDGEAERLGGLDIDHQLRFGRLLDRQARRLLALEDTIDVRSRTPNYVDSIRSIGDQCPFCDELPMTTERRESMLFRQCHNRLAVIIHECVRCGDQATVRLVCERRDGCLDFCLIVHRGCRKLDSERFGGRSEFAQECRVKRRGLGIEHERYAPDARGNLLDHLQPFPNQWEVDESEAGEVAAWLRQAGHETLSDRIVDDIEYDRDGTGRLFQCGSDRRPASDDEVRCRTYQLLRIGSDPAQVSTGISMLDSDIAVLGPPERLEPLPKRNNAGQRFRIVLDVRVEERDATHARRLLRVHSERPRSRAAEQRDEGAALHSITSSACCRNGSGMVRPSAFAVLRLTISSNLVGSWTGKSPALAPLRIRSTYDAARR